MNRIIVIVPADQTIDIPNVQAIQTT